MKRRDALLALLSFAAGAIDAFSFSKYNVFTSAMSGNTVLLGIAIGQAHLSGAIAPALAFGGYGLGVALGAALAGSNADRKIARPLLWPLAAETVLLAAFAALSLAGPPTQPAQFATIALAASGMGVQGSTARHFRAPGINTVVFTSTITAIVGAIAAAVFGKEPRRVTAETWLQTTMLFVYLAGAGVAAALLHFGRPAAVVPPACAALAAVLSKREKDRETDTA